MQKSLCSQTDVIKAKTGTMESHTMVWSTWNLKQHRRRHWTKRTWHCWPARVWVGFSCLGNERELNLLQSHWSAGAFRRDAREAQAPRCTDDSLWLLQTQPPREHETSTGGREAVPLCCRSTRIKLLNLRRSQVDLLPSSGKGQKSSSITWVWTRSPWCKSNEA